MPGYNFENPIFYPYGLRIDDDDAEDNVEKSTSDPDETSFTHSDAPLDMVLPLNVQRQLNTSGDVIQNLWGE